MKSNFSTLKAEVKGAFEAYLAANGSVRDRAKAHGEALIRLREACVEQKLDFTETLKGLGVVVSTAYNHIKLVLSWEQAEEMARTMGVEFEALCISDVIGLVRPPRKPKQAVPPAGDTPGLDATTTVGDSQAGGDADDFYSTEAATPQAEAGSQASTAPTSSPVTTKRHPGSTEKAHEGRSDEALEAEVRAHLGTLFNRAVRVIYPKGNQTVEVELGGDLVVIVPAK